MRVKAWDAYREARTRASDVLHQAIRQADYAYIETVSEAWERYKEIVDGAKRLGDLLEQAIEVTDE